MVNRTNCRHLADYLETISDNSFGMEEWGCCIAGHAMELIEPEVVPITLSHESDIAAKWLGLSEQEAYDLFLIAGMDVLLGTVTRRHAIAVLRYLAETGKIYWPRAFGEALRVRSWKVLELEDA